MCVACQQWRCVLPDRQLVHDTHTHTHTRARARALARAHVRLIQCNVHCRSSGKYTARALVHTNASDAARVLHCKACDASEGIFYGDVTNLGSLLPAAAGAVGIVSTVGTGAGNETEEQEVEWHGVENQVAALANQTGSLPASQLTFVLISSMGQLHPRAPVPHSQFHLVSWRASCTLPHSL
jgi:uncharacterized protein YbjT (DUF2867 family)